MKYFPAIFLFLLMAGVSFAIVVQDYSVATNAPTGDYDVNWDHVYNYKASSGVAVGVYWLLTAAHVGDDGGTGSVTVGNDTYYQQEVIFHDTADLALVRYDKPFPGHYPLHEDEIYTRSGFSKTYQELVMVGFGFDGVASSSSFTQGSSRGIKRWGTNKGERETTMTVDIGAASDVSTKCFQVDFNSGETPHEAGANIYDSGGPVFIDNGSEWALTGITLYRSGSDPYTGNSVAMIHDYSDWIHETMDAITGDSDSDGIPNWWEEQYATDVLASADQDGDGQSGIDEYIADTDPTDSNSFGTLDGSVTSSNQTFTFFGSTARQVQLFYTTNGLTATNLVWTPHGSPIWGEGADTEIVTTNIEDRVFYRVQVTL